jgi:hypothetical protein
LAIKAAIALNAYGNMSPYSNYSDVGRQFADTLYAKRTGTDHDGTHFTLTMDDDGSWATQYNLYFDILLKLNTFPSNAYRIETDFYPTVRSSVGVPLDSRVDWGKTDWMLFAAGIAVAPGIENEGVRDMFINDVHGFLTNGQNAVPFSDNLYRARPVVGGHFALMALNGPNQFG